MSPETATLQRQLQLYRGLVEVSALINGIGERSELLPAILEVARRVLHSEAASLFLLNEDGELELASAKGGVGDQAPSRVIVPRGQGLSGWVLEHGEGLLVADAYEDPRFFSKVDEESGFRTRSMLCVPLVRGDRKIGVLQIMNPMERPCFDSADLEACSAYGFMAAAALDKLETTARQRLQERADREAQLAHEIQMNFLPRDLPSDDVLAFGSFYRPAQNVGGDFYDVLPVGPDEVYFVIGDVSGKGVPSALLMAQALSILRLIIRPGFAPDEALERWNAMLRTYTIHGMFVTAILGRIIPSQRKVELASAGHCAPFHITSQGEVREITVRGVPPLGILPSLARQRHEIQMGPKDVLFLYTDGLVESFDSDRSSLGNSGLRQMLASPFQGPQDVVDSLAAGESAHRQQASPSDDLTMLAFGFR